MNDRHGLIVLSGGMDSVTLLYDEPGRACQFTIPLEEVGP